MGTEFRIVFYASDSTLANQVKQDAYNRIDNVEKIFSDYVIDSHASYIAAYAGKDTLVEIDGAMSLVMSSTMAICGYTGGVFDVTIGPLTKLWRRAFRRNEFPTTKEIEEAKAKVGCENVLLTDDNRISLEEYGMSLDFGGVAKGFAIDDAYKVIQASGIRSALVDGGGDIRVGEAPPNKEGWEIALENGEKLILKNIAIASSGSTYKYLEKDGVKYSHIIDPRTGYGMTDPKTVTVKATTCLMADIIATTFCLAGKDGIQGILANIDDYRVEIID